MFGSDLMDHVLRSTPIAINTLSFRMLAWVCVLTRTSSKLRLADHALNPMVASTFRVRQCVNPFVKSEKGSGNLGLGVNSTSVVISALINAEFNKEQIGKLFVGRYWGKRVGVLFGPPVQN